MADADNKVEQAAPTKPGLTVPLTKDIEAHGEKISSLFFREPTGADIANVGFPLKFDFTTDPPGVDLHEQKMEAMMVRLAAIPPSSVRLLSTRDWATCAWRVAGFFMPNGPI